jgi:8-amino-7-oxononanoate synthase
MSSASARLLSGTSEEFTSLESTLKKLYNRDGCLIFNTGYQCNLGVISTLCQKGDIVFSDKLNHASIIDGMKISNGDFLRYNHLDYAHLEKLLAKYRNKYNRAIIISESIFSMDGDIADIDKLIELKNKYNCLLMIDEAHAFCAFGENLVGLTYNKDVDIITATFGKALGSFGAFCIADNTIITYLVNKARSFIFSTSIPPINIAWTNWLLTEKIEYLTSQKEKLSALAEKARKILGETPSDSHIIPIVIGKAPAARWLFPCVLCMRQPSRLPVNLWACWICITPL